MEKRERQFIPGLSILLLAIFLLGIIGALLHDFNGVEYGAAGALIWGGATLITFVLGTIYLSRRLLPVQGNAGWSEGFRLLWRNYTMGAANLLYGRPRETPATTAAARKKQKAAQSELAPSFKLLGAGFFFSHEAAAITRGNSYRRAAGPGLVFLNSGESVAQVFDLRPQSRSMPVNAITKDGIPVETSVSVSFRVRRPTPGSRPRSIESDAIPYPYDRDALFELNYAGSVDEENRRGWTEQVCPQAAALLVTEIAKFTLDQLLLSGASDPLKTIKAQVKEGLLELQKPEADDANPDLGQGIQAPRQILPRGIEITGVGVGAFQLADAVLERRIATWQVGLDNRMSREKMAGDLEAQKLFQQARVQAQVENIEKLLTSIDLMRQQGGAELHEVVMLRLMEMAEAMSANLAVRRLDKGGQIVQLSAEAASELRQALGRDEA